MDFRPGPEQRKLSKSGGYATLPAPILSEMAITRGTGSDGTSCADLGVFSLVYAVPDDAKPGLHDMGFLVRVTRGEDLEAIFHETPVVPIWMLEAPGPSRLRAAQIEFHWLDNGPELQRTIDLDLEALFVAPDGREGPAVAFSLRSVPRFTPHDLRHEDRRR